MTLSSGIRRYLLLTLLAIAALLPAQSQELSVGRLHNDTIRSSYMDSLYRSLNDSATWQKEMEFVRSLEFESLSDSSLLIQDEVSAPTRVRRRPTWKEQEEQIVWSINASNTEWIPEPRRAVWLSLLVPGGGQIYNRKYWKLPIVYGGYVGCIYALTWNQATYTDYQNAYVDIMDSDPQTKSYEDFLPPHYEIDTSMETWLKDVFKERKNKYRRYRDLSIFAFAGMYIISAIDAYVDAELSHFDISSDLSLKVTPNLMIDRMYAPSAGLSLALNF